MVSKWLHTAIALLIMSLPVAAQEHAAPELATRVNLDGAGTGRTFGGVGAISGGGGNSRLLIDYPAKQRNEILDYLFKPGYGASLQILKIEIGGDANSTDGAEPSIEHTRGIVNCNAGYEFWLAEEAKRRNPNLKLYGLAWAAPGWIGDGKFWSQDMIDYLMTWLNCASSHGLTIDYLGGWNERGFDVGWYKRLHSALAAKHSAIKIVGDDSGWEVAAEMAKDPDLAKSIDIIGVHYSCEGGDGGNAESCHSTAAGVNSGKPLWDSESGSQDDNTGAGPLIRAITRGYLDSKMTGLLNWPLVAAITPNLPYPTVGLMIAAEPWSGNYSIGQSLWITAHVTQFTQSGWSFVDSASGYLGGDRLNGSYISLRSPDGADASTIVETTTATSSTALEFNAPGILRGKQLHVWATDLNATYGTKIFTHVADLNLDGSDRSRFTLQPGYVYTFSTIRNAEKGNAEPPATSHLELPYKDDFERYASGSEARYVSDMQGSFEVQACAASRGGKCLQQMAPTKPIEWQDDSDVFTLIGDPSWSNYTVSVDVELAKPGTVELIGRAEVQKRPQSHQQGYYLQVDDQGVWTLLKNNSDGDHTLLAKGVAAPLGTSRWHRLSLSFDGAHLTASLDGHDLTSVTDASYRNGQIGLGTVGYDLDQFDDLSIKQPR
ncbi:family 16 glycoside hydrolase [Granulicella arctica]|uniref:family 16 glycoside hydrolase n=1 Tax=Granulicella arctica TaxID=940613 RepID=UPI0021E05CA1|nr:family 16 glycoside hydrolase [Granulicella arctica]